MATKAPAAKTAPATAPVAAPALTVPSFEDAAVPTVTRKTKDNPYAAVVSGLAENRGTAKAFTVAAADVKTHVRLVQQAGKSAGVTMRNTTEDAGNGAVKVTIWAVDRITRPRKGKDADASAK